MAYSGFHIVASSSVLDKRSRLDIFRVVAGAEWSSSAHSQRRRFKLAAPPIIFRQLSLEEARIKVGRIRRSLHASRFLLARLFSCRRV
jgi:hypothetical protein